MEYGFVNYKKFFNARKITKKVIIVDFQGIITDYHYKMLFLDTKIFKMKFLFFCILSLGIFSCNIPKIMPQKQTLNTKQNLPQVLIRIKTLCI